MNAPICPAHLGLCRCELVEPHNWHPLRAEHRCKCGCTWRDGAAGVEFGTKPVRPAVRS